jgi:glycosyltransferase
LAELPIEVIATLNDLQLQGIATVPDNVRVIEWVSLTQLLPTCSAIIHHGGMGTFAAASAARVPQIVCDTEESVLMRLVEKDVTDGGTYRIGWEFGVREAAAEKVTSWELPAKKVEATPASDYVLGRGGGARLNHRALSVEEIGKLIMQVVDEPSFQQGADSVHERWLATPGPADVVPVLAALTAAHRR